MVRDTSPGQSRLDFPLHVADTPDKHRMTNN
jgi:hypothetical protein